MTIFGTIDGYVDRGYFKKCAYTERCHIADKDKCTRLNPHNLFNATITWGTESEISNSWNNINNWLLKH